MEIKNPDKLVKEIARIIAKEYGVCYASTAENIIKKVIKHLKTTVD